MSDRDPVFISKKTSNGVGGDPYREIDIDQLISKNELLNDIELNHIDSSDIKNRAICDSYRNDTY